MHDIINLTIVPWVKTSVVLLMGHSSHHKIVLAYIYALETLKSSNFEQSQAYVYYNKLEICYVLEYKF